MTGTKVQPNIFFLYLIAALFLFFILGIQLITGKYESYAIYVWLWMLITLVPLFILFYKRFLLYKSLIAFYIFFVYLIFFAQPFYPLLETNLLEIIPYSLLIILPIQVLIYVLSQKTVEKSDENNAGNQNNKKQETSPSINLLEDKTKILFLAANPFDTGRLRLDQEFREIDEALQLAKKRDNFDLESKLAIRVQDLRRALLNYEPNIIHFSGHGKGSRNMSSGGRGLVLEKLESGGIILENDSGKSHAVSGNSLAGLFELFSPNIHIVLLNSCYSQEQGAIIHKYVPYVIGMNTAIPDNTAIVFATSFYDALGAGRNIEFAFAFAKNSIDLEGLSGASIPQLLINEDLV